MSGATLGWKAVGAAVQGTQHREAETVCEDAVAWTGVGDWMIAAVCDGAGSAPHAEIGATVGVTAVVDALASSAGAFPAPSAPSWRALALGAVEAAREAVGRAIREVAPEADDPLPLGHATLLAVLASPSGGVFIHVGDGLGLAICAGAFVVSPPANGEYANETFFFTQPDWAEHVRLTPFDAPPEAVMLLSDGAAELATEAGGQIVRGFVDPLTAYLAREPEPEGTAALRGTLSGERAARLTGDDLTVFWAAPAPPPS